MDAPGFKVPSFWDTVLDKASWGLGHSDPERAGRQVGNLETAKNNFIQLARGVGKFSDIASDLRGIILDIQNAVNDNKLVEVNAEEIAFREKLISLFECEKNYVKRGCVAEFFNAVKNMADHDGKFFGQRVNLPLRKNTTTTMDKLLDFIDECANYGTTKQQFTNSDDAVIHRYLVANNISSPFYDKQFQEEVKIFRDAVSSGWSNDRADINNGQVDKFKDYVKIAYDNATKALQNDDYNGLDEEDRCIRDGGAIRPAKLRELKLELLDLALAIHIKKSMSNGGSPWEPLLKNRLENFAEEFGQLDDDALKKLWSKMGGHCDQRMLIANLTSDFILATAYQTLVNSVELDAFNQVCSARHIDLTKIEQETEFRTMPEQDFVAGDKKKK